MSAQNQPMDPKDHLFIAFMLVLPAMTFFKEMYLPSAVFAALCGLIFKFHPAVKIFRRTIRGADRFFATLAGTFVVFALLSFIKPDWRLTLGISWLMIYMVYGFIITGEKNIIRDADSQGKKEDPSDTSN